MQNGEQEVFREDFQCKIGSGWEWIREDDNSWKIDECSLTIATLSGGMWTDSQEPPRNILLRALDDVSGDDSARDTLISTYAVEVTVNLIPEVWGMHFCL